MRSSKSIIRFYIRHSLAIFILSCSSQALADKSLFSVTLDNDLFLGEDNGYTNGLYLTWFDIKRNNEHNSDFWVLPLKWTLSDNALKAFSNIYTVGQMMLTASDITVRNPDNDDIPYAGLLFITNTYIAKYSNHADKVSTTMGIVGPATGAEQAQKFVHELTGSDDPQGWDNQLHNELVYKIDRGRAWRSWVSSNGKWDIVPSTEASLGTLKTAFSGSVTFRYGKDIENTFPAPLLVSERASNPVIIDSGWYIYTSFRLNYLLHTIFLDGNTYKDSRSVNYDPIQLNTGLGFACSFSSVTLALSMNRFVFRSENSDKTDGFANYGSITLLFNI